MAWDDPKKVGKDVGNSVGNFLGTNAGTTPEDSSNAYNYVGNAAGEYNGLSAPTIDPITGKPVTQTSAAAASAGPTNFNNITDNPAYTGAQTAQMAALSNLAKNGGRNAASDANLAQIQQNENANAAGQRGAIMQNAQARGMGGSGNSLLAQLSSSQNATNNQSARDLGVSGQEAQTAIQAGQGAAGIGAGLQQQNYAEQANRAGAQDAIDKFNAGNSQTTNLFNAGQANQIGEYNSGLDMAGQQYNSQIPQQQFADQMGIAAGKQKGDTTGLDYWSKKYGEDQQTKAGTQGGLFGVAGKLVGGFMGGGGGGAAAGGASDAAAAASGGRVPGAAQVHGDSLLNDHVPITASPGEVVVPRTLVHSGSPAQIHSFVKNPPQIGGDRDHEAMLSALRNLRSRR